MTNTTTWQVLFVDDEPELCRQVREFLEGESVTGEGEYPHVKTSTDFAKALELLEARRFDLVILDVRLGAHDQPAQQEEAGVKTLESIRHRCFVPIVFYTALPRLVQDLKTPLIQVVEKTEGLPRLLEVVRGIFATRLPAVNRALIRHIETVQRDYMWDFVASHWEQFGGTPDRTALAYLLARRLALSLSGPGVQQLAKDLGDPLGNAVAEGQVHPMQYYVMPPVDVSPLMGDLYSGRIGDQIGHWVLLTPSCDLVTGREKAEWVLLARCLPLNEQDEYRRWQESLPNIPSELDGKLRALLKNNRQKTQSERFYFLPGALTLPDLVVDLQQLETLPQVQLSSLERLASLDSPFAAALLARFSRYFGRLGTLDLDVEVVFSKLR